MDSVTGKNTPKIIWSTSKYVYLSIATKEYQNTVTLNNSSFALSA